jgi:hypothetical protein
VALRTYQGTRTDEAWDKAQDSDSRCHQSKGAMACVTDLGDTSWHDQPMDRSAMSIKCQRA